MKDRSDSEAGSKGPRPGDAVRFVQTVAVLTGVWLLLSGKVDVLHLGLGVLGAVLIALSFSEWRWRQRMPWGRFFAFIPWHLGQVVVSNLRVTKVALSPKDGIEPSFIERDPLVRSDRALTLLGCAVTLTPGTLTVEIDKGRYVVHALDDVSAGDIERDVMAHRVGAVFGEGPGGGEDADADGGSAEEGAGR